MSLIRIGSSWVSHCVAVSRCFSGERGVEQIKVGSVCVEGMSRESSGAQVFKRKRANPTRWTTHSLDPGLSVDGDGSCLMGFIMNVSLLLLPGFQLLLVFSEGAKIQKAGVSLEDQGTRLRDLWKLHMRERLLKGKASNPHPIREGVKQQLLYCRVGIGYHLQILPSGSVGGVHTPTEHCWLNVFAMRQGVVGIRGVQSALYLCMNEEGLAYATEQFSDDCLLKENLEENHYTTYSSVSHPGIYLALSHKGELRKGNSVGRHQSCTHFLPRRTS